MCEQDWRLVEFHRPTSPRRRRGEHKSEKFHKVAFQVLASLKRLASGVLTHPVTIGVMIDKHTPERKKDKPKSIHLMGTDRPEVGISSFQQESLLSGNDDLRRLLHRDPEREPREPDQDHARLTRPGESAARS